ncbi:MAG: hypothetical protein C0591_01100 [Marinilabiliales bacterium]|nr:MAG: hypothetical protein C0591_01100 [Marinilabiliales bacterium]
MTEPCVQDGNIKQLRLEFQAAFSDVRDDQKRIIELLEGLARHDERMRALADRIHDVQKSVNALFDRVRIVEAAPGRVAGKVWWLIFGGGTSLVSAVVASLIVWGITHA